MTDLQYIHKKCKANFFLMWEEQDIDECKLRLQMLNKDELHSLRHCRWMTIHNPLYPTLLELLYEDHFKQIAQMLESSSNDELYKIAKTTKSEYQKQKIAEIFYSRYEGMEEKDKKKVYKMLVKKGFINKEEVKTKFDKNCTFHSIPHSVEHKEPPF